MVADSGNGKIRKVTPAGVVTTVVDLSKAHFTLGLSEAPAYGASVYALALHAGGDLYATWGNAILKVQLPPP